MLLSNRSRVFGLTSFVVLFCVAIIVAFSSQLAPIFSKASVPYFIASIWFYDRIYLDFVVFLLIGILLINGGKIRRICAYIWWFVFVGVYTVQFMSVFIGGEFVSILAVDSVFHLSLLNNITNWLAAVSGLAVFSLSVFCLERYFTSRVSVRYLCIYAGIFLSVGVLIEQHHYWLPESASKIRNEFYSDRSVRIKNRSPVESLFRALFRRDHSDLKEFTEKDIALADKYGFAIHPNRRFPLIKDEIYSGSLPDFRNNHVVEQPNIIILFVEGLSARATSVYSDEFPDITPNMEDFSKQATIFHNYYNHTYATYRGLLGQLCSFYPFFGGLGGWHTHYQSVKKVNYYCLSDLYKGAGYETIFLDTHRADAGYVDEMMVQLGFNRVINAEEVRDKYIHEEPYRNDALSDNQLMTGLIEILREKEKLKSAKPFLLGTYNLETHAWQKIAADGKRYPHKRSYVLDSIFNYDYAFGRFWRYFQQSPFYDNTILIVTSDHAHYPGRDYVNAIDVEQSQRPYFVDQIPLMIYDPRKKLAPVIDANYSTSINFAPTLAHLVSLNSQTAFLGHSLFDQSKTKIGSGIASAGEYYYLIDKDGVRRNDSPDAEPALKTFVPGLIQLIHQLENHNRIWYPENKK